MDQATTTTIEPRTEAAIATVDGVPLEPTEAASTVFVAKVRRTARPDGTEID